jgi:hypothetical protein
MFLRLKQKMWSKKNSSPYEDLYTLLTTAYIHFLFDQNTLAIFDEKLKEFANCAEIKF